MIDKDKAYKLEQELATKTDFVILHAAINDLKRDLSIRMTIMGIAIIVGLILARLL